jgi:hypothetical protein
MAEMLQNKRATRGLRMNELVGEAADAEFYSAEIWQEADSDDSDNDSFEEEEAKPDVFDSDFNESESSSDSEDDTNEKTIRRATAQRSVEEARQSNKYKEPAKKRKRPAGPTSATASASKSAIAASTAISLAAEAEKATAAAASAREKAQQANVLVSNASDAKDRKDKVSALVTAEALVSALDAKANEANEAAQKAAVVAKEVAAHAAAMAELEAPATAGGAAIPSRKRGSSSVPLSEDFARTVRNSTKSKTASAEQSREERKQLSEQLKERRSSLPTKQDEGPTKYTQKQLLIAALDTELENEKWLTVRRMGMDEEEAAAAAAGASGSSYASSVLRATLLRRRGPAAGGLQVPALVNNPSGRRKFASRRGSGSMITFTEVDDMPAVLGGRGGLAEGEVNRHQEEPIPRQKTCVVTGAPARYLDPLSGMPYATAGAFKEVRRRHAAAIKSKENAAKKAAAAAANAANSAAALSAGVSPSTGNLNLKVITNPDHVVSSSSSSGGSGSSSSGGSNSYGESIANFSPSMENPYAFTHYRSTSGGSRKSSPRSSPRSPRAPPPVKEEEISDPSTVSM